MRGRRAAHGLHRRDAAPADPATTSTATSGTPRCVVALILTYDAVLTFRNADGEWGHMGLGTLVFLVNIVLIWLYTLSCHSCRHAVGGRLRHFSKHPVRYQAVDLGLEAQRQARGATPGCRCSPWRSPTSTSAAGHRRHHRPEVLLMTSTASPDDRQPDVRPRQPGDGIERHTYDVVVIGAGGAGPARRDRRPRRRRPDRDRLQVAAGQGAHRDGRGRHRRRDGQRLARGQLGGALPRHHAWREDAQQLADGPAARPGGARAGAWSSRTGARCSTAPRTG